MAIGDSAGLLFRVTGDSTDAVRALKDVERAENDLDGSNKLLGGSLSDLSSVASLAGAGILAIGAAAVSVATSIFTLTQAASEFGSQIFDASEKTGLSARTLSAMKFAADQSGTSLESVTAASAKFSKTIADASNGSEKAQAKLTSLGVTSTDLDTALAQALATIVQMKPGTDQMAAAMDAFGKSGADLLPFIKSFDGDLEALTQSAKDLGVTIEDDVSAAADQFGDTLDTITAQLESVGRTIGIAFMPMLQRMADGFSAFLTKNQGEIKLWAETAVNQIDGVIAVMQKIDATSASATGSSIAAWAKWALQMRIMLTPIEMLVFRLGGQLAKLGGSQPQGARVSAGVDLEGQGRYLGRGGGGKGGASNDAAAKEQERKEKAELDAKVKIQEAALKTLREAYTKNLEAIRKEFQKTGDVEKAWKDSMAASDQFSMGAQPVSDLLAELSRRGNGKRTQGERDLIEVNIEERVRSLNEYAQKGLDGIEKLLQESSERQSKLIIDNALKTEKEQESIEQRRLEAWRKSETERLEADIKNSDDKIQAVVDLSAFLTEQAKFDRDYAVDKFNRERDARKQGISETIRDEGAKQSALAAIDELYKQKSLYAEEEFQQKLKEIADKYQVPVEGGSEAKSQMEQLRDMFAGDDIGTAGVDVLAEAFRGLNDAISQTLQSWILLGSAGQSFRQFAAQVIAGVAQMAAVKAVFELAEGFAALARAFFGDPKAGAEAALHFKSAAIYGTVAAIAALAGRGTAGNSFQQQTAGGGSSATGVNPEEEERRRAISRQSEGAYGSGTPFQQMNNMLKAIFHEQVASNHRVAGALEPFETAPAGAVVQRGFQERPGLVGKQVNEDIGRNSKLGSDIYRSMGGR